MNNKSVTVEKIINGGYGLARREDGRVVLLRNSLPGETVAYSIDEERRKTLFGTVTAALSPHPGRIVPPCPYYGKCGGCSLQHCGYEQQLQVKKEILDDLFLDQQLHPSAPLASPDSFGYRQRIRLQIQGSTIGFYRSRSTEVIGITTCLIAHPAINAVLQSLLQSDCFLQLCRQSAAAELHLDPPSGSVTLMLHSLRPLRPTDKKNGCELAAATPGLERVFFKGDTFSLMGPFTADGYDPGAGNLFFLRLDDMLHESIYTLCWEISGFSQVNVGQNRNIVNYVLGLCTDCRSHSLLDVYCGMGNFSIPLAGRFGSVVGVEAQNAAIRCAQRNSVAAELDNTTFIKGTGEAVCHRLHRENTRFDTVVLDPPRQGIPGLAAVVAGLARQRIIYISCDPATLARDISMLQKNGLRAVSLQPFDMFPQTHHIETVAVLEKN